MTLILVFGDSIAWGFWDERGGWTERLWDARSRNVYNLGVDGNTSEDVKSRFSSEAKSRGANKNSIIIFAVGLNDSSRMNGEHRVNLNQYVRNMEELIDHTKNQFTQKVLCVGLTPIDQSKTVPFILEKTVSFFATDQRDYDSSRRSAIGRESHTYR